LPTRPIAIVGTEASSVDNPLLRILAVGLAASQGPAASRGCGHPVPCTHPTKLGDLLRRGRRLRRLTVAIEARDSLGAGQHVQLINVSYSNVSSFTFRFCVPDRDPSRRAWYEVLNGSGSVDFCAAPCAPSKLGCCVFAQRRRIHRATSHVERQAQRGDAGVPGRPSRSLLQAFSRFLCSCPGAHALGIPKKLAGSAHDIGNALASLKGITRHRCIRPMDGTRVKRSAEDRGNPRAASRPTTLRRVPAIPRRPGYSTDRNRPKSLIPRGGGLMVPPDVSLIGRDFQMVS
jgi:hypothetical protein